MEKEIGAAPSRGVRSFLYIREVVSERVVDGGPWAPLLKASSGPRCAVRRQRRLAVSLEAARGRIEAPEGAFLDFPAAALKKPRHLAGDIVSVLGPVVEPVAVL